MRSESETVHSNLRFGTPNITLIVHLTEGFILLGSLILDMGELDGYKYPDRDVDDIVEVADVLVNEFGDEPSSEETFAQSVGHSSKKSGAYKQKIADARKYGVLPSRGLKPTDLAFRIANPKDNSAKEEAMFEMFQNISLLSTLHSHLDGKEPPSEFWRVLTEISDANPAEAKEVATEIRDLYRQMLQYDSDDDQNQTEGTVAESEDTELVEEKQPVPSPKPQSEDGIMVRVGGDTLHLEDVSVMNLQLAVAMLEQKQEQLKREGSGQSRQSADQQGEDSEASLNQF